MVREELWLLSERREYRYLGNAINTVQLSLIAQFDGNGRWLSGNSGGLSNYHGMAPFDMGHPRELVRDLFDNTES